LTRSGSKSTLPAGVKGTPVDYDNEESLISALHGQQFLIITLSVMAPPDTHSKIVRAAAKAGVPYIMPNVYGYDIFDSSLFTDSPAGTKILENTLEVEKLGASYIAMVCGYWYEWSLALGEACFGFDLKNKKVIFYDEGTMRINTSTWRQCGRALAALLSLPEHGNDAEPSVSQWKNKPLYLDSFKVSQRDMLDSIHRVTGTSDADWEMSFQASEQRYKDGMQEMQNGSIAGFQKALYARAFFPNGGGDFTLTHGTANQLLRLPKEDLDQATKRALDMAESGWNPFAHAQ
jgi:hypothetical protein